jgi:DNA-directed RNA polymerase specialized sigma24 family protein
MIEIQNTESDGMSAPQQAKNRAAALYRLAFLLTGDRARSLDVALEAIDSGDCTNSFFSGWMMAWSQRLVIAKALSGIRDDLAASARRTATLSIEKFALPPRDRLLDPDADGTGRQIETALLAIDVFPRSALLLTVFEGMSPDDAAILLDADRDLVRKARIVGLQELTRNLAPDAGLDIHREQIMIADKGVTTCLKKRCTNSSNKPLAGRQLRNWAECGAI